MSDTDNTLFDTEGDDPTMQVLWDEPNLSVTYMVNGYAVPHEVFMAVSRASVITEMRNLLHGLMDEVENIAGGIATLVDYQMPLLCPECADCGDSIIPENMPMEAAADAPSTTPQDPDKN